MRSLRAAQPRLPRPSSRRGASSATAPRAEAGAPPAASGGPARARVPLVELRGALWRALRGGGHPPGDAATLLDALLYAQLRDNSQGVVKVATGAVARDPGASAAVAVEHEGPLSARLGGGLRSGALALSSACLLAAAKARARGVGVVATRGCASSSLALGHFAAALARRGLLCLVLAQSPEYVAPHGAARALFGTNPLCVAIPAGPSAPPLVLDMATSAYTWWGVHEAAAAGAVLPVGVALDGRGDPTTDPAAVLAGGSLLPAGGAKGSGLGLVVELLAGAWAGAAVADKAASNNWGNLVVALDPSLLGSADDFEARVRAVLAAVRALPPAGGPGAPPVRLPGERGDALAARRLADGVVPMEPALWAALRAAAEAGAGAGEPPPRRALAPAHAGGGGGALDGPTAGGWEDALDDAAAAATAAAAGVGGGGATAAAQPLQPLPGGRPPGGGLAMATRLVHPSFRGCDPYGASSPPLYQTATFAQPSATTFGAFDYTRSGNPTRQLLEAQVAELEGAARGLAFTSGMAALTAAARLAPAGSRALAGDDLYGGTARLLASVLPRAGVAVTHVDTTDLAAVAAALSPDVALVFLESPTNPRLRVTDIAAVCALVSSPPSPCPGALVVVDNSMLGPLLCRPLSLGAHISMCSATKFLAGHSDVMAGTLAVADASLGDRLAFGQNAEGTGLAPFDCWLTLRGLRTMALRQRQQQASAAALAAYLCGHRAVARVNWPGLAGHPGRDVHARQADGPGSVLSFETGSVALSAALVEARRPLRFKACGGGVYICRENCSPPRPPACQACTLFKVTVSFGGPASLISLPCFMSHASIPADVRAARGLPDHLVRISCGFEDTQARARVHQRNSRYRSLFLFFSCPVSLPPPPPPPARSHSPGVAQDLLDDLDRAFQIALRAVGRAGNGGGDDAASLAAARSRLASLDAAAADA